MSAPAPLVPPFDPEASPAVVIHPTVGADWPSSGLGSVSRLATELPAPTGYAADSWIAVDGGRASRPGMLARLLGQGASAPRVHLAVRCTALLVRGYVDVCADDAGVAYGRVPRRTDNP